MALTIELWTWCLSRDIHIQAEHLPGVQNCLADKASRTCMDSRDWKLQLKLIKQFLVDRDTDLFATRLTHQLPRYVSWHLDSKANAADAFSLNWATLRGYAFPRSSNTTNSNQSSERQNHHYPSDPSVARVDLVAFTTSAGDPSASSPTFNTFNTEERLDPTVTPPMLPRLHLAVWLVSSDRARQSAFRNTSIIFAQHLFASPLTKPTIHHGENGMAGVIGSKLIQFRRA